MNWQIARGSREYHKTLETPASKAARRQAWRMLDRVAEEYRWGWKRALMLCGLMLGKTRRLSISECQQVIAEIKKRGVWKKESSIQ